jgi:hypothetical protein
MGSTVVWEKHDTKTIEFYHVSPVSDTTYSTEIIFMHPIISNGHVKIRLKANR